MMQIESVKIAVRDLVDGYTNDDEEGVRGYHGKLDIRPPYQREFVYKDDQQQAVIRTVMRGFPLNSMYWVKRQEDNEIPYEVMDGQQRILSICQYVKGRFSILVDGQPKTFFNLTGDQRDSLLSHEIPIYVCSGTESEKLEWFKTVNIAGEKLTDQELRNAVYAGPFTAAAKKKFSKSTCVAYKVGNKYVNGDPIRQDYLETAIKWINHGDVEGYMSAHDLLPERHKLGAGCLCQVSEGNEGPALGASIQRVQGKGQRMGSEGDGEAHCRFDGRQGSHEEEGRLPVSADRRGKVSLPARFR